MGSDLCVPVQCKYIYKCGLNTFFSVIEISGLVWAPETHLGKQGLPKQLLGSILEQEPKGVLPLPPTRPPPDSPEEKKAEDWNRAKRWQQGDKRQSTLWPLSAKGIAVDWLNILIRLNILYSVPLIVYTGTSKRYCVLFCILKDEEEGCSTASVKAWEMLGLGK